jgi:glycosyltransferase 2 family protein
MGQPSRSLRSFAIQASLLALTFGLLSWTVWANRGQIREVIARSPDGRMFALGYGFSLAATLLTFVRWYFLVRALRLPFSIRDALRLGFIGLIFNVVVPGAVGGDVAKAAFLCREQARKTLAVASVLLDRVVGLLGLFLLASVAGAMGWSIATALVRRLIVIVWGAAALGLLGLIVAFSPAVFARLARLVARWRRLEVMTIELQAMASAYRARPGAVVGGVVLSIGTHALNVLAFYAVGLALFPRVPTLGQHMLIVPLVFVTTAVPLPFGALGLGEAVSGQLFRLIGHEGGAITMMGFRVLQYGLLAVAVVVYLLNPSQVRSIAATAGTRPATASEPEAALVDSQDTTAPAA